MSNKSVCPYGIKETCNPGGCMGRKYEENKNMVVDKNNDTENKWVCQFPLMGIPPTGTTIKLS